MSEREPADYEVRKAIRTRLNVTMLVEAAAGTGKTTSLVARMVNLVGSERARASTIAAITFTVKAAAQLRERFQEEVERAIDVEPPPRSVGRPLRPPLGGGPGGLHSVQPPPKSVGRPLRPPLGGGPGARRNSQQALLFPSSPRPDAAESAAPHSARMKAALEEIDRGFIGTTHAFCARLLRERPVEAGLDPEFEELDEAVATQLTAAFWNRWYEEQSFAGNPLLAEAREVGLDRKTLRGAFERVVEYPDVVLVSQRSDRPDLRKVCDKLGLLIDAVAPHLPTDPDHEPDPFEKMIVKLLRQRRSRDLDDPFEQFALLDEGDHAQHKPVQKRWPDGKLAKRLWEDYSEFVIDELRPAVRLWREHVHGIALDVLRPAAADFASERRRNGTLTFQDLLVCARDMLRDHAAVRRYFQRRFTHLLVDEFQDTDPLQAEVLFYLTGEDANEKNWRKLRPRPGSLFIVGDPKQSIYRFRRADITTYLEVRKRIEESGGEILQLSTNFRSAPTICTFVNDAFRTLFTQDDIDAGRQAPHVDLTHFYEPDPPAGVYSHETPEDRSNDKMAEAEAEWVGQWILRNVDASAPNVSSRASSEGSGRGPRSNSSQPASYRFSDILLISYQRPRLSFYARTFERLGIPYQITGSKAFSDLAELKSVMPLLRAIVDPDDEVSIVAFLRGPLNGADDDALYRFVRDGGKFSPFPTRSETAGSVILSEEARAGVVILSEEARAGVSEGSQSTTAESLPVPTSVTEILRSAQDDNRSAQDDNRSAQDDKTDRIAAGLRVIREAIADARLRPPAATIARLFDRLGILPLAASRERPGTRSGNLLLALNMARESSARGESLAAIVEQFDNLLDTNPDIEELDVDPARTDAVRLMNLHQVKGLEAAVVFLIDPADEHDFDTDLFVDRSAEESRGHFVVTREWGRGKKVLAAPPGWEGFEQTEKNFKRAEKLRLLYVAATRARRLLIVGFRNTARGIRGAWRELATRVRERPPERPEATTTSSVGRPLRPPPGGGPGTRPSVEPPPKSVGRPPRPPLGGGPGARTFEQAQHEIAASFQQAKETSYSVLPITKIAHNNHIELVRAEEGLGKGMSWGRVLHRLFEAILRDQSIDVRLYAENLLKDEERDVVELTEVMRVVEAVQSSRLWQRVKSAEERYVEIPFALEVAAADLGLEGPPSTLLHGTIDLVFREKNEWYVVDYKTDSTVNRLDALTAYYAPQVRLYAEFWSRLTAAPAHGGLFFVDQCIERWVT